MELKRTSLGMQIEGYVKKEYEDAFEDLEQSGSYSKSLEYMENMFKALEKSRPRIGRGIDWAQDIIKAYRTTGKLFIEIYGNYKGKLKEPWKKFEKKIKNLEDIFK